MNSRQMNPNQNKWVALAILATALAFTSCKDRLEETEKAEDTVITFSASIGGAPLTRAEAEEIFITADGLVVSVQPWGAEALQTRTEYAGKVGNPGTDRERINWTSGDKVNIYSPQANAVDRSENWWLPSYTPGKNGNTGDFSYASYEVIGGAMTPETHAGTLKRDGNYDLQWSNEPTYDFYGIYPSSVSSFSYASETATLHNIKIPFSQPGDVHENMTNNGYMWAYESGKPKHSNVCLSFYPLFTAYEIALTADESIAAKTLTKVSIFSESKYLRGQFNAQFSNLFPKPFVTSLTNAGNEVAIENLNTQLSATSPTTFTLLTLPADQTELTLSLAFSDGTVLQLPLKQKNTQTGEWDWYTVPACSKVYITSQVTDVGDWVFDVQWRQQNQSTGAVTLGNPGEEGFVVYNEGGYEILATDQIPLGTIKSYVIWSGGEEEGLPYSLEYSEYTGTLSHSGTESESAHWGAWTTASPSWINISEPASHWQGSSVADPLGLVMDVQTDSRPIDAHTQNLRQRQNGTTSNRMDLSLWNPATGQSLSSPTTANCYVVNGWGYYKFPLVYGNAIKDGTNNTPAYSFAFSDNDRYLNKYKDHTEGDITTPYILSQHNSGSVSATLIWMDAPGLVENVNIEGSGPAAYLTFDVPRDYVCQGNAIMAVQIDGVVAWSWHIWVTDEDLTVKDDHLNPNTGFYFMNNYIGWCDQYYKEYLPRKCRLRAVQIRNGERIESKPVVIVQTGKYVETHGNSLFFQWGRKDPMPGWDGDPTIVDNSTNHNKVCYYSDSHYRLNLTYTASATLGAAIQNPNYMYIGLEKKGHWGGEKFNLWDSGQGILESNPGYYPLDESLPVKTVYDPSPIGFCVPPAWAWSGINLSNTTVVNGFGLADSGIRYQEGGSNIFFQGTGFRPYGSGAALSDVNKEVNVWSSTLYSLAIGSRSAFCFLAFYNPNNFIGPKNNSINVSANGMPVLPVREL